MSLTTRLLHPLRSRAKRKCSGIESQKESIQLSRGELGIIALLFHSNGEIEHKHRLHKLAFLFDEDVQTHWDEHLYSWKKYDYGPYSTDIDTHIRRLEKRELVTVNVESTLGGNKRYTYRLTPRGESVSEFSASHNTGLYICSFARQTINKYGDKGLRSLIEHLKEEYPQFYENSVYKQ